MTKDQQEKFNTLNEAWAMLEPRVKDKQTYKDIMGTLFKMFYKKRKDKFTDEWWKEVVDEFLEYPKKYYGTKYFDFAGDLSMGFLNFWEKVYKIKCDDDSFRGEMFKVFNEEIKRIGR